MTELPIVDIAPLFEGSTATRADVDERIVHAVRQAGGFVVANYPDADKVDARARRMLSFFDLDDQIKRAVANRVTNPENPNIYRGYQASLQPGSWAHNEVFDIGPDEPVDGPPLAGMQILAERNVWPEVEPVEGWRRTMRAYYDHMHAVATAIMLSVGRGVGFEDDDILARFQGGNSTLRLLNYPPPPKDNRVVDELPDVDSEERDGPPLAAGRHTDGSGVSLLWQQQPGLQAQAPDGTWRDVPLIDNCISVHLGDVIEMMTDGRVPATPHRVIDHQAARQSVGFFLEPSLSAELGSLDADMSAARAEARWRGTYGWALLRRISGYGGFEELVPRPD
ncbi:MAG: 2OG-Fe(II) oxygenase family protein [Rhodovibrionaceae bacterium]|nr:2OG-Fe(II) oxygenase family protein [Rhodovibrionaceae bacterium]